MMVRPISTIIAYSFDDSIIISFLYKTLIKLHVKVKLYHFPGAHPASYTIGTGSFLEVKWPERGNDHPPLRLKKQ
jgi:hypothetical protein